ncbi:hypothetical protein [Dyella sp. Tek66A03]|uniref:hypothetical protein n=1 Tax=Dyella sp. Tek66A03 TaxID=3458298 RepID=UPI00403E8CDF
MNDEAQSSGSGLGEPSSWDVEEALTWVSYGFFRHLKHQTRPDASELSNWWDQLLAAQMAIGFLVAECESISSGALTELARQRLTTALARISTSPSSTPENHAPTKA